MVQNLDFSSHAWELLVVNKLPSIVFALLPEPNAYKAYYENWCSLTQCKGRQFARGWPLPEGLQSFYPEFGFLEAYSHDLERGTSRAQDDFYSKRFSTLCSPVDLESLISHRRPIIKTR